MSGVHNPAPEPLYPQILPRTREISQLGAQIESLKAEHEEAIKEKLLEYAELDRSHRKLLKENKELIVKHTKVCSEVKALKEEKEMNLKENKSLSVALKATKKEFDVHVRNFEKEKEAFRTVIEDLGELKSQQEQETRKAKKLEKKLRQKERKGMSKVEEQTSEETAADENQDLEENNNIVLAVTSSNRFELLNSPEKDSNHLKHDPDQSLSVSLPSKPNMFSTNLPSLTTTSMEDMPSPNATDAPNTRDSVSSITGSTLPPTKATSAVTSSEWIPYQNRMQCDKCDRRCVHQKDMDMHILLWHSDYLPLKNNLVI